MYYLYKKSKQVQLPHFHYRFKRFDEFYDLANRMKISIFGVLYINIVSDAYEDIVNFIEVSEQYNGMIIYIEVNEALLGYIKLAKPYTSMLSGQSNYEVYKTLVNKYSILFDKGVMDKVYFSIGHSYEEMDEAMLLIKDSYPNEVMITLEMATKIFVIEDLIYPRSVLISYLRLDRGRRNNLDKCVEYFGNDLVLYSMRKTTRKFLKEKISYLKSGKGSYLIKTIPVCNLTLMTDVLDYNRHGFKEIKTIMALYEKGETINDFVHEGDTADFNAEFDSFG